MSKIYDALRKAEKDRGLPKPVEKTLPAIPLVREDSPFLAGMDEGFRRSLLHLKNSMDSEMRDKTSRVVLFTSAARGEGKTTIVASLARVLALAESQKILLVDCSVRDPGLHRLFGLGNDRGIVDYLAGRARLKEIAKPVDQGALDLITLGAAVSEDMTQSLFNSERLDAFFKEAGEAYDYVLVDSSAILEAPETAIIGGRSDGIVMVIHAGKTKREVIQRAIQMAQKLGGRFVGTVLNRKKYHIPEFIYRRV